MQLYEDWLWLLSVPLKMSFIAFLLHKGFLTMSTLCYFILHNTNIFKYLSFLYAVKVQFRYTLSLKSLLDKSLLDNEDLKHLDEP